MSSGATDSERARKRGRHTHTQQFDEAYTHTQQQPAKSLLSPEFEAFKDSPPFFSPQLSESTNTQRSDLLIRAPTLHHTKKSIYTRFFGE
ncbi:hypothetical protein JOB18_037235 [Solea senegalensis]|uniref:Uncharacterized protein n=1 Tax=Solea senegalensis TaxID=28829 RepID=A0AAV6S7K2_SOLSE|nr:hypothetical protein JOB18_037235 [Solea senegalensis]